jgi:very-short-patch-repair endonuclease
MVWDMRQSTGGESVWEVARRQHGVVSHGQLLALGVSRRGIEHRLARGRLHSVHVGVYAVGRSELEQKGAWLAAVLACGPSAVLSHDSAAALWGFGAEKGGIDVSVRHASPRVPATLKAHRRAALREADVILVDEVPVTTPIRTLVDRAAVLDRRGIEREINEADKRRLVSPPALRKALRDYRGQRGVARLRHVLDRRTFRLTDSELERLFLPLVRQIGLPLPLTQQRLNGFKVDFFWLDLGLVVETDGLTYHRTPAQQAQDLVREQIHMAAGLTPLRFTHEQVKYESAHVRETLARVAARLGS